MNKLIPILAGFALAVVLAPIAEAQTPGPGQSGKQGAASGQRQGGNQQERMKRMREARERVFNQLDLNSTQKKQVAELDKKMDKKRQELMKEWKPGGDMSAMRDKMRGMQEDYRKDLGKILTPAQMKKHDELMKAEREKMRANRPGGQGGRPGGGG